MDWVMPNYALEEHEYTGVNSIYEAVEHHIAYGLVVHSITLHPSTARAVVDSYRDLTPKELPEDMAPTKIYTSFGELEVLENDHCPINTFTLHMRRR